jgi:acyl-CoA carboxylase epsilon subunit-like protein
VNDIRVLHGRPDEIELAAVVVVLLRAATDRRPAGAHLRPVALAVPDWSCGFRAPGAWR